MIETQGLSHINLEVTDPEVSLRFYQALFGVKEYFRDEHSIQVLGPGAHDVLAFVRTEGAGTSGGISHFGFRLKRAEDIGDAIALAGDVGRRRWRYDRSLRRIWSRLAVCVLAGPRWV